MTSVLEPVGSQPVRITVRFEGMGQDLVEQTFEWPVRERVRRFSHRTLARDVREPTPLARRMMMSGSSRTRGRPRAPRTRLTIPRTRWPTQLNWTKREKPTQLNWTKRKKHELSTAAGGFMPTG